MTQRCDYLLINANLASLLANGQPYGAIIDGAVALTAARIIYAGPAAAMPDLTAETVVDCHQGWLLPGLVDCHTHLVFGGDRAREFELRQLGASYEEIARGGGGIASTVAATRKASEDELLALATARLRRLLEEGVTTVEIKSGYGLDLDNELKMLRVARRLGEELPVTVRTTFLGAHALPPEFRERGRDAYIDHVCGQMLPEVSRQGLADAVDVFCEGVGFSPGQCLEVYRSASALGLPIKAHAEQLSNLHGARLAAEQGALSVDHLEYLAEEDIDALACAGSVAVLLPGAFYFLRERQPPPVAALRAAGVPMAVATDLNPGTSPLASLLLAMNQAVVLFGLTPEESLWGASRGGALALGLTGKGLLAAGMDADLGLWDIAHPAQLSYGINLYRPTHIWQEGRCVHQP
jgi:imidazolonepropionase